MNQELRGFGRESGMLFPFITDWVRAFPGLKIQILRLRSGQALGRPAPGTSPYPNTS